MRSSNRPKLECLPSNTKLSGVGLSAAQRTNLLTVIVAEVCYPESVLSKELFELFREAVAVALDKEPASNCPRFETSFSRGGVFIFVASNPESKAWFAKPVAELRIWEGVNLKVSGVEILQKMLKATAWISGEPEDPAVVLRRPEGFNHSLRTASCRIVRHETSQEANATIGFKYLQIVQVPESQARALTGFNDRPFYHLGQITFRVITREEELAMETERPEQP